MGPRFAMTLDRNNWRSGQDLAESTAPLHFFNGSARAWLQV